MAKRQKTGGRQKGTKNKLTDANGKRLSDLAKEYEEEALETLASVMRSIEAPAAARVSAANSILDRARGKPVQSMEHSGPDGKPIETKATIDLSKLSEAELAAYRIIAAAASRN